MLNEEVVNQTKEWEQIEVLGLLDVRKVTDDFPLKKLANGHTKPNRNIKKINSKI